MSSASGKQEAFVLGAGFSKAVSRKMPVLNELSKVVFDAPTRADSKLGSLVTNFELCLTYLSEDNPWLSEPENLANRARFLAAARSIARVILRYQRLALTDPPPPWLKSLIEAWHSSKSRVITLNYDTLVEKAYMMTIPHMPVSPPDYREIYAVPIPHIGSRLSGRFGFEPRPTLQYLKLHGSINWCYSGAPTYYGEVIYDLGITEGWSEDLAEPEDDIESKAPEKVHLIVPPTASKSTLFNNELVRNQWRLAQRFTAEADVIYCLGYSLPETDAMMRFLLATSGGPKVVVPVNTRKVAPRYRRLLAPHRIAESYIGMADPIERFVDDWQQGSVKLT